MENLVKLCNVLVTFIVKLQEEESKIQSYCQSLEGYERMFELRRIVDLDNELKWDRIRYNFCEILKLIKQNQYLLLSIRDSLFEEKRG